MSKRLSRSARWQAAVAVAQTARRTIEDAVESYHAALADLQEIQSEFQDWRDNLPENLQSSALGEKLDAVCEIDLESELELDFDPLDEADGIDLPLGFGRD